MKQIARIQITPCSILLNGQALTLEPTADAATTPTGKAMLTAYYKQRVGDYPKFYKMDALARLGFLAAELLLQSLGEAMYEERDDRAIVLVNRSASLVADRKYETTIHEGDNYFPSPSDFVYTLPNIVTGEIAIRHHYHAETTFLVLEPSQASSTNSNPVPEMLIAQAFCDPQVTSVLGGWLECSDENEFEADLGIFIN